ncbi:MAG: hypothetical protein RIB86_15430 [Imperialibacter sp.]
MIVRMLLFVLTMTTFHSMVKAQKEDSTGHAMEFAGSVNINNNGIALVPTFSLGKPSAIVELSVKKNRFSFIPQLRYNLKDRQPWNFIFWGRYKMIDKNKLKVSVGSFSSIVFRDGITLSNGIASESLTASRLLIGELIPSYQFSPKVSVGLYYMFAKALDTTVNDLHLVSLNSTFSKINLTKGFLLAVKPQVYYLGIPELEQQGLYANAGLALSKKEIPVSITSMFNKAISSNLVAKDFVWNVGITYSF